MFFVVIRTNGGSLTINAATDTVKHYGYAEVLDVQAIASASYHEYGTSGFARLVKGHFVVESEGVVNVIYATGTKSGETAVIVDNNNGIIGKAYATQNETANIYNGDAQEGQSGNVLLEKYDAVITEAVVTAMNSTSIVEELNKTESSAIKTTIEETVSNSAFRTETDSNNIVWNLISNLNELQIFRNKVNNAGAGDAILTSYFKLTNDIDLSSEAKWTPISKDSNNKFMGVFDGNNKVISNLTIVDSNGTYQGLFGYVGGGNTTIKNVKLSSVNINAKKRIAGLVAEVVGDATFYNCSIDNESTITGSDANIAGLIAEIQCANNSTIHCEKMYNYATIVGTGDPLDCRTAGICCQTTNGEGKSITVTFKDCHNYGSVTATGAFAGGIMCAAQGPTSKEIFDNCSNSGTLTGTYTGDFNAWLTGNNHEIEIKNYNGNIAKSLGGISQGGGNTNYLTINGTLYGIRCSTISGGWLSFSTLYNSANTLDGQLFDDLRSFAAYVIEKDELHRTDATRQSTGDSTDKEIFYNTMFPHDEVPSEVGDMISQNTGDNGSYLNPDWAIGQYNIDNGTDWDISKFRTDLKYDTLYKVVYSNQE